MKAAPIKFVLFAILSVALVGCNNEKQETKATSAKEQVLMGATGVGGGCDHIRSLQEVRENRPCRKEGH